MIGGPKNETELLDQTLDLAKQFGWFRAHFRHGRTKDGWRTPVAGDGKGFPDLVLVPPPGRGRVIYRELKSTGRRLEPDQEVWRDRLLAAGEDWAVWYPIDWPAIVELITFGRAS